MNESLHKRATPFGVSAVTLAILLSACGGDAGGTRQTAMRPFRRPVPTPYVALAGGGSGVGA